MTTRFPCLLDGNDIQVDGNEQHEIKSCDKDECDSNSKSEGHCWRSDLTMINHISSKLNLEGKKIHSFRVEVESDESDDEDYDEPQCNVSVDYSSDTVSIDYNSVPYYTEESISTNNSEVTIKQEFSNTCLDSEQVMSNVVHIKEEQLENCEPTIITTHAFNSIESNYSNQLIVDNLSNQTAASSNICNSPLTASSSKPCNDATPEINNMDTSVTLQPLPLIVLKKPEQLLKSSIYTNNISNVKSTKDKKEKGNKSKQKQKKSEILYSGEIKNKYTNIFLNLEEEVNYLTKQAMARMNYQMGSDSEEESRLAHINKLKANIFRKLLFKKKRQLKLESLQKSKGITRKQNGSNVKINNIPSRTVEAESSQSYDGLSNGIVDNVISEQSGTGFIDYNTIEKFSTNETFVSDNFLDSSSINDSFESCKIYDTNKSCPEDLLNASKTETIENKEKLNETESNFIKEETNSNGSEIILSNPSHIVKVKIEMDTVEDNKSKESVVKEQIDEVGFNETEEIICKKVIKEEMDFNEENVNTNESKELMNEEIDKVDIKSVKKCSNILKEEDMTDIEIIKEEILEGVTEKNMDRDQDESSDSSTTSDSSSDDSSSDTEVSSSCDDNKSDSVEGKTQITGSVDVSDIIENSVTQLCITSPKETISHDGFDKCAESVQCVIHKEVENIENSDDLLDGKKDIADELNQETLNAVQFILDLDNPPIEKECISTEPTILFENPPVEPDLPIEPEPPIILPKKGIVRKKRQRTYNKKYSCPNCSITFDNMNSLNKHCATTCPETLIVCHACNDHFTNLPDFWNHIKSNHFSKIYPSMKKKIYVCCDCNTQFKTSKLLQKHTLREHSNFFKKCLYCSCKFFKVSKLNLHIKEFHCLELLRKRTLLKCLSQINSSKLKLIFSKSNDPLVQQNHGKILFNSSFAPCLCCNSAFNLEPVISNISNDIMLKNNLSEDLVFKDDIQVGSIKNSGNETDAIKQLFMLVSNVNDIQKVIIFESNENEDNMDGKEQCKFCSLSMVKDTMKLHIINYHPDVAVVSDAESAHETVTTSNTVDICSTVAEETSHENECTDPCSSPAIDLNDQCTELVEPIYISEQQPLELEGSTESVDESIFMIQTNDNLPVDLEPNDDDPVSEMLVFHIKDGGIEKKQTQKNLPATPKSDLLTIRTKKEADYKYKCSRCDERFRQATLLKLHMTLNHQCSHCNALFDNVTHMKMHVSIMHPEHISSNSSTPSDIAGSNSLLANQGGKTDTDKDINYSIDLDETSDEINLNSNSILPSLATDVPTNVSLERRCYPSRKSIILTRSIPGNSGTVVPVVNKDIWFHRKESLPNNVDVEKSVESSDSQNNYKKSANISSRRRKQKLIPKRLEDPKFEDLNEKRIIYNCLYSRPVVLLERCLEKVDAPIRRHGTKRKENDTHNVCNKKQCLPSGVSRAKRKENCNNIQYDNSCLKDKHNVCVKSMRKVDNDMELSVESVSSDSDISIVGDDSDRLEV